MKRMWTLSIIMSCLVWMWILMVKAQYCRSTPPGPRPPIMSHDLSTSKRTRHDKNLVGLITNKNKANYRVEVRQLSQCCKDDNLLLSVEKKPLKSYWLHGKTHAITATDEQSCCKDNENQVFGSAHLRWLLLDQPHVIMGEKSLNPPLYSSINWSEHNHVLHSTRAPLSMRVTLLYSSGLHSHQISEHIWNVAEREICIILRDAMMDRIKKNQGSSEGKRPGRLPLRHLLRE